MTDKERLQALLVPYPSDQIDMHPVSGFVNNARDDDPRRVERVA